MTEPRDLRDPRAPIEPDREEVDKTPIATALREGARRRATRLARPAADKMATPGVIRGYETK